MVMAVQYKIDRLRKVYPWLSDEKLNDLATPKRPKIDKTEENAARFFDTTEINTYLDLVCPVDPRTGARRSDVDVMRDPSTPPEIKKMINDRLIQMGATSAADITDADIMSMLPSRYAQGSEDAQAYVDYCRKYIDSLNTQDSVQETNQTPSK